VIYPAVWNDVAGGGGGGGGMVIGQPVVGGTAGQILYINAGGNLFGDSDAFRSSTGQKETFLISGSFAQAAGNDGPGTEYLIQADNQSSNPTITFDGVSDTDTIIAAWNLANPSDTVSVISGGTNIPLADTVTLLGGKDTGLNTGKTNVLGQDLQGSSIQAIDFSPEGAIGVHFSGNLSPIFGETFFGSLSGYYDSAGNITATIATKNTFQAILTDNSTFNASVELGTEAAGFSFNGNTFSVDSVESGFLFNDGSGIIKIPFGFTVPRNR